MNIQKYLISLEPFDKLVRSVLYLQPKMVREVLESDWFKENQVSVIRRASDTIEGINMSISEIALRWKLILGEGKAKNPSFEEEWGERFEDMRGSVNEILDLLRKYFNDANNSVELDFEDDYEDDDEEEDEDVFSWRWCLFNLPSDINNDKEAVAFLSKKYRQIDVELWKATHNSEYGRIKTLLEMGANPFVDMERFDDEDDYHDEDCMVECAYLRKVYDHTDSLYDVLGCLYGDDDEYYLPDVEMAGSLYGCSVSQQIVWLMDKYGSFDDKVVYTPTINRMIVSSDDFSEGRIILEYDAKAGKCAATWYNTSNRGGVVLSLSDEEIMKCFDDEVIDKFMKKCDVQKNVSMMDGTHYSVFYVTDEGKLTIKNNCDEEDVKECFGDLFPDFGE